jgi:sugar phosphate isomerase/epimerase
MIKKGVMASQIWPTSGNREGATLKAFRSALEGGAYQGIQTVHVPYPAERRALAQIVRERNVEFSDYLTRILAAESLNLSDLDPENRKRTVKRVVGLLDEARESGASSIGLVSGRAPDDPKLRPDALEALADSLVEICQQAAKRPGLTVLIEPLDYEKHKCNTLGTTSEAVELCRRVESSGARLELCVDTSHVLLNGEDVVEATIEAQPFLAQLHFCNPVLDESDPLFGDQHVAFGAPGALRPEDLAPLLQSILADPRFDRKDPLPVFLEVLNTAPDDGKETARALKSSTELLESIARSVSVRQGESV